MVLMRFGSDNVCIHGIGAYVPPHRISRSLFAEEWDVPAVEGERSVASADEDAFTMATEAALACLAATPNRPDAVYFASTSAPYAEKGLAATLATVIGSAPQAEISDFGASLRCGASALRSAAHVAGAGGYALVGVGERRSVESGSIEEAWIGDGGAALLLGPPSPDPVATLEASVSVVDDYVARWRLDGDTNVRSTDVRFIQERFSDDIQAALTALLGSLDIEPHEVDHLCLPAFDGRTEVRSALRLGFEKKQILNHFSLIGDAGAAGPLLSLAHALESAKKGARAVVVFVGEGAEAFSFIVGEGASAFEAESRVSVALQRRIELTSYTRFHRVRGALVGNESMWTSPSALYREKQEQLALVGTRCSDCGVLQYPRPHSCLVCGSTAEMTEESLARRGRVLTYTSDYLYPSAVAPTVSAVVDLDNGARFFAQVTDPTDGLAPGTEVDLVLRRLHVGGGFPHYFWKLRPVAGSDETP